MIIDQDFDQDVDDQDDLLEDRRLLNIITTQLGSVDMLNDSELQAQRARNYRAYYGESWWAEQRGRSTYVSHDVFDVTEGSRAIMMEALTATDAPLAFKPTSADDVVAAEAATKWSYDNFFRKNSGYKLLDGAIYDGLVAKMAAVKVYWKEKTEYIEEEFPRMPIQEFAAIFQQHIDAGTVELGEYTEVIEVQTLPDGTMIEVSFIEGTIIRAEDQSYAAADLIAPERFLVGENNGNLEDSEFCGEWSLVTKSDLLDLGFDDDKIEGVEYTGDYDYVDAARHSNDMTWGYGGSQGDKGILDRYRLYELFIRYDVGEDGYDKLYQVWYCGGQIFEANEVEKHIYFTWSSIPLPHRVVGMAQADVITGIQRQKSTIQRLMMDNLQIANNPTKTVQLQFIEDPRQLVENRIGTNISVTAGAPPNVVAPVPTTPLSPLTFSALEMLNQDKSERGGYSRLAAGMDPSAMSGNNADRTIEKMTNNSNRRLMKMARDFVEVFYKPMIQALWALGRENDSEPVSVSVNGQPVQIAPKDIGDKFDLIVNVALTPEEKSKRAQSLMVLHQMFSTTMGIMYTDKQKYSLASQLAKLMGEPDIESILLSPESQEYTQITQMQQQAQQQQEQQQAQMQQQMMMQQEQQRLFYEQTEAAKVQAQVQKDGEIARKTAAEAYNKEIENNKYAQTNDIRAPSEADRDFAQARKYNAEAEAQELENDLVETGVDKLIEKIGGANEQA